MLIANCKFAAAESVVSVSYVATAPHATRVRPVSKCLDEWTAGMILEGNNTLDCIDTKMR